MTWLRLHHPILWHRKALHLAQTVALCLTIALAQWLLLPERELGACLVYSLSIGLITWAVIDLGRHCFASSRKVGWPSTGIGIALVLSGITCGFLFGTLIGDAWTGHLTWAKEPEGHGLSSLLIAVIASIVATVWFYAQGRSQWLAREMELVRQQANEARLRLLEAQLEPHMLFNTLANLQVLVRLDAERADDMLTHLIAYLRATLDASQVTLHPLQDEMDRVQDYLALMAVRMGPRLRYALELPSALERMPVPPLVLQPLVENAIRHGLEPQIEGGTLTVRALRERCAESQDWLVLQVIDDGRGLPPAGMPLSEAGFGLRQVRERLTTLYGAQATLTLSTTASGQTLAQLRWPLTTTSTPSHAHAPA